MSGGQGPRNPAGAHAEEVEEENLKKSFLNPLTNSQTCGILNTSSEGKHLNTRKELILWKR
jgi:hypothetical protein